MSNRTKTVLLLILGLGALLLVGGAVSAGPDGDNAPYAGGCPYGYSGGDNGCGSGGCEGYGRNLGTAQSDALRQAKEAFYKETRSLRTAIVEKQTTLAAELARQSPDAARAGDLQNELNDLKSRFNTRYLQFVIAMKKIIPGYGSSSGQNFRNDTAPSCCQEP